MWASRWVIGLWVCLCLFVTYERAWTWADEGRLWQAAIETTPLKPRPWLNYGRTRAIAGDEYGARLAYGRALSLADDSRSPYEQAATQILVGVNLALADLQAGSYESSARHLHAVMQHRAWREGMVGITDLYVEVLAKCGRPCVDLIS